MYIFKDFDGYLKSVANVELSLKFRAQLHVRFITYVHVCAQFICMTLIWLIKILHLGYFF